MTTANTDHAPEPYPRADIAAAVARVLRRAKDPPQPDVDGDRSSGKYAGLAQDFRGSAWQHLDASDLPQASNKAWGLVAETVKAISAEHGGFIHKHRSISEVVTQLCMMARNAGDADAARQLIRAFGTANQLHANFYEDELSDYGVMEWLMQCEELSDQLYALFWPAGVAQSRQSAPPVFFT